MVDIAFLSFVDEYEKQKNEVREGTRKATDWHGAMNVAMGKLGYIPEGRLYREIYRAVAKRSSERAQVTLAAQRKKGAQASQDSSDAFRRRPVQAQLPF